MMYSRLMSGQSRRVSAANFNFYPEPSIHPDRVMTEHDFIYLLEGQWEVCQDGERYLMEPDDVLLLEAGRHHYGELPCLAGTRTMFLHVSAAPKDSLAVSGSLPIPTLTKACPLSVKIGFQQIIDEHYSKSPLREIRIAALIDLLLCDLAQTAEHAPEEWPVGAVRSILLKQPEVNYTAAELSAKLGLPERRLRYLFRQASGMPLHRYQLELKLDMARQLLCTQPDRTLSDIAETFGFSDAFHLSHAYKRRFGHAPKDDKT